MMLAVDLDPAVIGFVGVLTGVAAAQLGEWLRWRRTQGDELRRRRQSALLDLLRHCAIATGAAGTIADMLRSHGEGHSTKLNLNTEPVDAACSGATVAADELRVLGPSGIIEPAVDLLVAVLDVRDAALRDVPAGELQLAVHEVYETKLRLIGEAAKHQLADAASGSAVASDEAAATTPVAVVRPRQR